MRETLPVEPNSGAPPYPGHQRVRVSIVRAADYHLPQVRAAVADGISQIGGLERIVRPGARVFVKINHLPPPSPAERGIVTHPIFAEAVIGLLKDAGAEVTVGDDIESAPDDGFALSGFREMCQRADVPLVDLKEAGFVEVECHGRRLDRVFLSRIAAEADVIVNLPKLKTHALTVLTGGVKNMYGVIPTSLRRRFHGEFVRTDDFSLMLTDVFSVVKPHLTIMDGIVAMEGAGPSSGPLRKTGIILTSQDAVAVDAVVAAIVGVAPADIDTTRHCHERGLGVGDLNDIDLTGESIESVAVTDFRLPAAITRAVLKRIPPLVSKFLIDQVSVRPRIVSARCSACGECVPMCPTEAITIDGDTARIDDPSCIACLCCQETCRDDAVALRRSATGAVTDFLLRMRRGLRTRS